MVLLNALTHVQLSAVESLHDRHFVHRDIKPSNFIVQGLQADDVPPTVFLIDFGLARQFRNPSTYLHIRFTTNHSIVSRSEEHTSELQSHSDLVCRLLLEKKKNTPIAVVLRPTIRALAQ